MKNTLLLLLSALVCTIASAQQIVEAEYFIGTDPGPGNGVSISIAANNVVLINGSLPTTGLTLGFNSVAIRTRSVSGLWSNTAKRSFYVEAASNGSGLLYHEIIAAEYFVDIDPGPGQGTPIDIAAATQVDFSGNALANLTPGFHKIAVRTLATSGLWSSTKSRHFVVQANQPGGDLTYHEIIAAEYFVDTDPGPGQGTPIDISQGTDVALQGSLLADMSFGVHKLSVRTKATSGVWSSTASRMFIVKPGGINSFFEVVAAEYFIDTDPGEGMGTPISITAGNSVIAEGSVPTDGLAIGAHTMSIRFKGSTGIWCAPETEDFTIAELAPFTYTVTLGSPSCAASVDGFIELNVTSDPAQFTYTWNGAIGQSSLSGIPAGEYQLSVNNIFGDDVLDTLLTLIGPAPIVINGDVNNTLCHGDSTGSIIASAAGGTSPFIFDWSNFDPAALSAGTYELQVTDANGCDAVESFTVGEPDMLELVLVAITPVADDVNCDGAIEVSGVGGTPNYTIVWNDPGAQTTFNPTNLCIGTYIGTLTDANGCESSLTVELLASAIQENGSGLFNCVAVPNPSQGAWSLMFELQRPELLSLEVWDETGRMVSQQSNIFLPSGRSRIPFDKVSMAAGNYLVRVISEQHSSSVRMTILP